MYTDSTTLSAAVATIHSALFLGLRCKRHLGAALLCGLLGVSKSVFAVRKFFRTNHRHDSPSLLLPFAAWSAFCGHLVFHRFGIATRTRAKVFAALWIIAFDLQISVAVFDSPLGVALLHLDDESLYAVPASPGLMQPGLLMTDTQLMSDTAWSWLLSS